ncbi:hypothetical protein ACM55M_14820 [Flavobacterium sp. ZT3R25]|uniref:hypothetical protein n=1 Tax=Flavobacterium galactosi TaxID=3398735 RepID=UPI003A8989A6
MEQFKNLIDPKLLKRFAEGIKRFEEISNDGFVKLASYGWYVDADISLGYITGLMEKAINENRSKIIEEAVYCHQNGKYYASSTLFLSEADGICSGLLFKNRKNKEALKQYIAQKKGANFFSILMIAIENTNTIDSFYSKTNLDDSKLNRHGVMHGLDMDFGREINSFKAFSLLVFVSDFIDRL